MLSPGAQQHVHAQRSRSLAQGLAHLARAGRTSQVEARQAAVGKAVAGKLWAAMSLRSAIRRTPWGPSETSSRGMPRRSTAGVVHDVSPVTKAAFSARVIC